MKKNDVFKLLAGVPLSLILSAFDLISDVEGTSIIDSFTFKVFGRISLQNESVYLLTMQNLLFVVVCNILFADSISAHFRVSSVYVFSRIYNRAKWYRKQVCMLLIRTSIFSSIYLITTLLICIRKSTEEISVSLLNPLLLIVFLSIFLCGTTTLLINLLSIRWGTNTGFVCVQVMLFALVFIGMATSRVSWATIINPVSCLNVLEKPDMSILILLTDTAWFTLIFCCGSMYVKKYDVFLYDAEIG